MSNVSTEAALVIGQTVVATALVAAVPAVMQAVSIDPASTLRSE